MDKRKTNQFNLNTILNMILATFTAVFLGMFLKIFAFPCWFICGMVAVGAVITEHLLTICPFDLEAKYKKISNKIKDKVSSWKN